MPGVRGQPQSHQDFLERARFELIETQLQPGRDVRRLLEPAEPGESDAFVKPKAIHPFEATPLDDPGIGWKELPQAKRSEIFE